MDHPHAKAVQSSSLHAVMFFLCPLSIIAFIYCLNATLTFRYVSTDIFVSGCIRPLGEAHLYIKSSSDHKKWNIPCVM